MNDYYRPGGFSMMPPAVKNLLIINVLFFVATWILHDKGIDLYQILGLSWVQSENFRPWQFISYMFMHADFTHLFFNMFALWMFGYLIENFWGAKRFLTFYFVTGIGAALVQLGINWFEFSHLHNVLEIYASNPNITDFKEIVQQHFASRENVDAANNLLRNWSMRPDDTLFIGQSMEQLRLMMEGRMAIPMVGASGAVFGILLAFGMMFPNQRIYIYFLFPIKAKYFVIIYGAIEFFFGISGAQSGVAHFAHLGGMLFGFLLIMYWRNKHKFRR
ncbi:MAG: rhomboid family intramembrane serine protease [Bacteroidales bacterium]